jgi:hypothetical protein
LTYTFAAVQFTQYFLATRLRPDRQSIDLAWVQSVIDLPLHRETHAMAESACGHRLTKMRAAICA